jgi:hypothetical protein
MGDTYVDIIAHAYEGIKAQRDFTREAEQDAHCISCHSLYGISHFLSYRTGNDVFLMNINRKKSLAMRQILRYNKYIAFIAGAGGCLNN